MLPRSSAQAQYTVALLVTVLSFPALGQRASACPASVPSDALTAMYWGREEPASNVFCGWNRKYNNDGSRFCGSVNDCSNCTLLGGLCPPPLCMNNIYARTRSVYAQERSEVRGWIVAFAGRDNGEDEWEIDVLVDVGWFNSSAATPLNTIQSVSNFLTPENIIGVGQANVSAIHPSTLGPEASVDGTQPPYWALQNPTANGYAAWGGTGGPVIHIEVDGWGAYRACNIDSNNLPPGFVTADRNTVITNYCNGFDFITYRPAGWNYSTQNRQNPNLPIFWPFPIFDCNPGAVNAFGDCTQYNAAFQSGDYVRIVGTLWGDNVHTGGDSGQNSAKNCWGNVYPNIGSVELHPVDYMVRLCPPTDYALHLVAGYAICDTLPFLSIPATINDGFALGPLTARLPNTTSVVNEAITNAFTTSSGLCGSTPRASSNSAGNVAVNLCSQDRFVGYYDAYWSCAPGCGCTAGVSDGCGGTCPGVTCATGSTCCPATPACYNLSSDSSNCGSCGNACPGGYTCQSGTCVAPPPPPCQPLCGSSNCGTPDGCGGMCPDCCTTCSTP